jgi:hypothetical protein
MFYDPLTMFHMSLMQMMGLPTIAPNDGHVKLDFKFDDIDDFYTNALDFNKDLGNRKAHDSFLSESRAGFNGLETKDILKYKYGYQPGVAKLEEVKEELIISGASCFKQKWDDIDGEEMSMDRFYDEIPFLQKRVRKHGFLGGKFVKIYVSINELGHISYESMLNRTYTAVSLIDHLESIGYRTEVYAISYSINKGSYKDKWVSEVYSEVCIKKAEEILNLPLLLTMLSPWCYRYWHFLMFSAHFNTASGMGQTQRQYKKNKIGEIHLESNTCLTKEDSKRVINEIKKLYDQTTEEEVYY